MKKIISLAFTALILLIQVSTPVFAEESITISANPKLTISRAGAIAMVISADARNMRRVRWYASHMPPMPLFSDVDQKSWYSPYLEVAFEQGIITGNANGLFRPEDNLNQSEAVNLAMRYKESVQPDDGVYLTIANAKASPFLAMLSRADAASITLPSPLRPSGSISRGDLFSMLQSAGMRDPSTISVAMIPVQRKTYVIAPPKSATPEAVPPTVATVVPVPSNPNPILPPPSAFVPVAQVPPRVQTQPVVQQRPPIVAATITTAPVAQSFSISMPSLGITALNVSHPISLTHDGLLAPLKSGVGHLFSYPGQGGKILVYGHSSGYPWDVSQYTKIFRQINKLAIGDIININYNGTQYSYKITQKQTVDAKDTTAYRQEGREELILYTCWPPDSIKQRYLVHAIPLQTIASR